MGTQTAVHLAQSSLCELLLYDVVEGLAKGRALDLSQSAVPAGFFSKVEAVDDFKELLVADIYLITAGMARTPGMSRKDLLDANISILDSIIESLKNAREDAVFVIVTNPLDVMVSYFFKKIGRPRERVLGMGGMLDSARFSYFISEKLKVPLADIDAWVLGAHSDSMVACFSMTNIGGTSARDILTLEERKELADKTKKGGAEIISYLKSSSAFLAPGAAAARLVKAILNDEKRLFPVSVFLEGEYGCSGAAIGVPVRVGRTGWLSIEEFELDDEEMLALKESFRETLNFFNELG